MAFSLQSKAAAEGQRTDTNHPSHPSYLRPAAPNCYFFLREFHKLLFAIFSLAIEMGLSDAHLESRDQRGLALLNQRAGRRGSGTLLVARWPQRREGGEEESGGTELGAESGAVGGMQVVRERDRAARREPETESVKFEVKELEMEAMPVLLQ